MDGGQAGVGQRGDVLGLQPGAELDHRARRGLEEVGEAAVAVDARKRAVEAVHVVADAAGQAQPAGDVGMHDDGVADLDVGHRRADLVDPAGVLVARGVGQLHAGLLGPLALLDVEVGAAQAGGADPHDHIERTVGLGLVDRVELQRVVVSVQPRGLHLPTSCVSGSRLWRTASSERQMPPLASRLVRTSRAVRSHRVSWSARPARRWAGRTPASPASRRSRAARAAASARIASGLSAGSSATVAETTSCSARRRGEQLLAQPRLARDQRLAREQLAQRLQVVVVGLAGERAREALAARERRVDLLAGVVILQLDRDAVHARHRPHRAAGVGGHQEGEVGSALRRGQAQHDARRRRRGLPRTR